MAPVAEKPTSVLVSMARLRHAFLRGFAKRSAEDYERHRQGVRWTAEGKVFRDFYARAAPRSVLDCPVGTGRWLDVYQDAGASVLGIDLSPHMLAEAAKKLRPDGKVRLAEGDVLDPAHRASLGSGHDLIVCTRFTHWLPTGKLAALFEAFAGTGSRFLIVGAKVRRDLAADPPRRRAEASLFRRIRSAILNGSVNHVHEEAALVDLLGKAGFELLEGRTVTKTSSSVYKFYLLRFDPARRLKPGPAGAAGE